MKKLFTLIAFLTVVVGAKAAMEWVEDYKVDYSAFKEFPFWVMGSAPTFNGEAMYDEAPTYKIFRDDDDEYKNLSDDEKASCEDVTISGAAFKKYWMPDGSTPWRQYFLTACEIPTEIDGSYKVTAKVRATEACTVNMQMGDWGKLVATATSIPASTEWVDVEWEFSGILVTKSFLVAQPGVTTAKIEWKEVSVGHYQKEQRPVVWEDLLTNGDAEGEYGPIPCAYGKEFSIENEAKPATIETVDGNKVFVVHAKYVNPDDFKKDGGQYYEVPGNNDESAYQWMNQFWIQSPQQWKSGDQFRVSFKYKASANHSAATQAHGETPGSYLQHGIIGTINFTTEWQQFEKVVTVNDSQKGMWSIAFNLQEPTEDVDYFFDDLKWERMVLDEGLFAAGANPELGIDYDLDNAVELVFDEAEGYYVGQVGTKDAYVSQVMVSTKRGNDSAFKANTLKPSRAIVFYDDPEEGWCDYTEVALAKLSLPGVGIWKVMVDPEIKFINFVMIEGEKREPIEINPNPTEIIINALERDWRGLDNDGNPIEEQVGEGQPWDNQFWIKTNRALAAGEETYIEFEYMADASAKSTTQCHEEPGNYIHWAAIGDINFTPEWQKFSAVFTVPKECDGSLNEGGNYYKNFKSIAFNLAEMKGANVYHFKNFIWKLTDNTESLIDQTANDKNFIWKVVGGGQETMGIKTVNDGTSVANKVMFNLAGQKVNADYKGIVIKGNQKFIKK